MCKYRTKLMAWLDRELEPKEMAELEQHLRECGECRVQIGKYKGVSQIFDEYCDVVMTAAPNRRLRRWIPVLAAAAGFLVLVAATALLFRTHTQPVRPSPVAIVQPAPPPFVPEPATAPGNTPDRGAIAVRGRRAQPGMAVPWESASYNAVSARRTRVEATRTQAANGLPLPPPPAVEVAIPAEAMFPPGAVPEGVSFIADVSFALDGSARQIRLRPRLTAIERSAP